LTVEPSLDSLQLYLREIGRVPLLTADQEVYLAKRVERGDLARGVRKPIRHAAAAFVDESA
jgi:DNA-directed RNA polymerase sigma subunit (sigma70/sigma32)